VVFRIDDAVLQQIIANTPEQVDKFCRSVVSEMVTDIKLSMGDSPPGKVYKRGEKEHIASITGYPPNVDTGTLRASIVWVKQREFEYQIQDGTEYGIYLEDGTEHMGHRPFMRPVFHEYERKIGTLAQDYGLVKP
jgi:HK97 gp10 family phage protein